MAIRYVLEYWEYERGWGSRLDSTKYLPATNRGKQEAIRLRDKFNARNTETLAPDWYMVCKGPELREVDLLTLKKRIGS